jgi:hypothetical protein
VMLSTHAILAPSCEEVRPIPPPPVSVPELAYNRMTVAFTNKDLPLRIGRYAKSNVNDI